MRIFAKKTFTSVKKLPVLAVVQEQNIKRIYAQKNTQYMFSCVQMEVCG